jgi:hypothetical protein
MDGATTDLYVLVFGIGCAIAAELIVIVNFCVFWLGGRPFLDYEGNYLKLPIIFILVPIAAGIVGMLGLALDVVQGSRAACVAVGIAWPSLLTVFLAVPNGRNGRNDGGDDDDDDEPDGEPLE